MLPQRVFRAGTWTSDDNKTHTYTEAQVAALADGYDPQLRPANFVEGHPPDDQPGFGLVAAAFVDAEGWLSVVPKNVEVNYAQRVNNGEYNGWSASLLPPGHPANPTPDRHYLKHVGAVPAGFQPGVSGQPAQQFCRAESDGVVNFYCMTTKPPESPPATPPSPADTPEAANFARQQAEFVEQQRQFAEEQRQWQQERATERAANFIQANRNRLYGNEVEPTTAALAALYAAQDLQPVSFTQGGKTIEQKLTDVFEALVTNRQPLVGDKKLPPGPDPEQYTQQQTELEQAKARARASYAKALEDN